MGKWITVCGLTIMVVALGGQIGAAEVKLVVSEDGMAKVASDGKVVWHMYPAVFAPGWKMNKERKVVEGYPKKEGEKTTLRFAMTPPGQEGAVNCTMTVVLQKETADFHYVLDPSKTLLVNNVCVTTRMPVEAGAGKTIKLGGVDVTFLVGDYAMGAWRLFSGAVEHATYPLSDVTIELTTDPETHCMVQDLREWGTKEFEVRFSVLPPVENSEISPGQGLEKKISLRTPGLAASSVEK